jgi:hypothetical protein
MFQFRVFFPFSLHFKGLEEYILMNKNKTNFMKKLLSLAFGLLFLGLLPKTQAQNCPPSPAGNGVYVMFDSNYVSGTVMSGLTEIPMCFRNTSTDTITGVQFRVWYDKTAFAGSTPIVTSLNTTFPQSLQYKVDTAEGFITITLVYTGSSSTFSIPNGSLFNLKLYHSANFWNYEGLIKNMSITGLTTFISRSSSISGLDKALTLYNWGGKISPVMLKFKGNFTNVTGTPSKNLTVALQRKPKLSSSWMNVSVVQTNALGNFSFNNSIDTSYYDIRIRVQGDTLNYGNIVTTADAHRVNDFILGNEVPSGFDFYSSDVNGSNDITIADVYSIFGRIAGRFTAWPNSVKDVKFFTASEYQTISISKTNLSSTITGVTVLDYNILPGTPDSVQFYVLGMGDANGTGYRMARLVPIEIVNPANSPNYIIDQTYKFDADVNYVELNLPTLHTVEEGNLFNVPVKVLCGENKLASMQFGLRYDPSILEFKGIENKESVTKWVTYLNPSDNIIDWGGYDNSGRDNLLKDGDIAFILKFLAKKPKDDWGVSPLWVTRKAAGNQISNDFGIIPTDGRIQVFKVSNGVVDMQDNEMVIYPNPTPGILTISFKVLKDTNANLGVYNIEGKKCIDVLSENFPSGKYNYTINLGNLNNGIYTAILTTDNTDSKIIAKKIIKIN